MPDVTGAQQQETLVALIRETGWWPPDLESRYRNPQTGEFSNVGQNVVLESVDPMDHVPPVRWTVRSEKSDSGSLSIPFKRYDMICGLTDVPTYCTVVVAADKEIVNPLTDCCAFVPFGLNDLALTPKGRIDLGEQALVAVLKITDQWPSLDLKKYLLELFPGSIWLEPGKTVAYDPAEWIIDGEGVFRDEMVRYYVMTNKRVKSLATVGIAVAKQKRPENIDPYRDCWATTEGLRVPLGSRLRGFKAASKELCRAAIAVYLDSLGAWPPGRDIHDAKRPERLVIREALQRAIATLERFNPPMKGIAGQSLTALRIALERHEDEPISKNRDSAIELFAGLNASLEEAKSLDDIEQVATRYHADLELRWKRHTGRTGASNADDR